MEEVRERLPFCLDFMAVNYCVYMYLFASPESVVLRDTVMLTQKIRHSMIANCVDAVVHSSIGNWQSGNWQ
jgi:hypothetical protein